MCCIIIPSLGQSNGSSTSYIYLLEVRTRIERWFCTCGVSRIVTAMHYEMVEIKEGEYSSENACNAQCKRESEDKCWVCVEEFHGWPNPAWSYHFCQHKADAPFSYLGTPGMTQGQCNGKFVCPKLEELPYTYEERFP